MTSAVMLGSLTKRFNDEVAVDSIDLAISDGEFFSILGPSGCGKTTTLRMIAGLEFPTAGSLKIFDQEVGTLPANERPVNTVFQHYALFPHMRVEANIGFGLRMQGLKASEIDQRVKESIELVQLQGMEKRKPSQLSGGQQQRVALARALVNRPKVLLLDEPLAALDLNLRQAMRAELKALQQELAITFIFVTHDQEEALTMSDRIAVMDKAKILQVGDPETIYRRPANRFVADFIGRTNLIEARTVDGNTAKLITAGNDVSGELIVAANNAYSVNTPVTLSIRPEHITLHPKPATSAGLLGTVTRAMFCGASWLYGVRMATGLEVEVSATSNFTEGSQVWLSWKGQDVAVLTQ